jgi:hypothetical protein
MKVEMRRALALALVLFFSLGPLTATLQADGDSRLPACCRRHGKHHCAMSEASAVAAMLAASDATPFVTAPAHCPYFPNYLTQSMAPISALAPAPVAIQAPRAQALSPLPIRASVRLLPVRARLSRGPPDSFSC